MRHSKWLIVLLYLFITACATTTTKQEVSDSNEPPPKLLAPNVKKIWIPAAIKNGGQEWESGHFIYRIDRNTSWSR